jgi:hypothetical protein
MTVERSPRGLLTRRVPDRKKIIVKKTDPGELPQVLAKLNRHDWRQQIAGNVQFWYQFATALEEVAENKKPADGDAKPPGADEADIVLDLKRVATDLRKQLRRVVFYLERIESDHEKGRAPELQSVYVLVDAAMLVADCVHQLTIVDNETVIADAAARLPVLKKNREAASDRSKQIRESLQARADEIFEQHPNRSKKRVAREIRRDDPTVKLKVSTIRRIIKKRQARSSSGG